MLNRSAPASSDMLRAKGDVKCEVNYFAREVGVHFWTKEKCERERERESG